MRYFFLLTVIFLICFSTQSWCQPDFKATSDSALVLYYRKLADSLTNSKRDSAMFYLKKASESLPRVPKGRWRVMETARLAHRFHQHGEIGLSEKYFMNALRESKQVDSLTVAAIYQWIGEYYTERAQYTKALHFLERAIFLYGRYEDRALEAEALLYMGIIFEEQGLYEKSLSCYFKANSIFEILKDTLGMSYVLNNVAITYAKQKNFQSAINYYTKAMKVYEKLGDSLLMANTSINLGITHKNIGEYDKASRFLEYALNYYKGKNNPYGLASLYHNFGELMTKQGKHNEALRYYHLSQDQASIIEAREIKAKNYAALARLYFKIGEWERSLQSSKAGLIISSELNLMETQRDAYQIISGVYKKRGEYKLALEAYENYGVLNDSILNENRITQINQMHTQFDVLQKDAEITGLKNEQVLQAEKNLVQRRLNNYLIGGGIILLTCMVLLAIIYWRTRSLNKMLKTQKQLLMEQHEEILASQEELTIKNEALVRLNNEKDEIIAMVSHDLRSPLNNIKGLIFLLSNEPGQILTNDSRTCINMINQVTDAMKDRINHMLNVEALNAGKINLNMELIKPQEIIHSVAKNFQEQARKKNIDLIVNTDTDDASIRADRNYLLQIYENLLANALKFSPHDKSVWLKITRHNGTLQLHVKDEGPGISSDEKEKLFSKYQSLSAKPTDNEESSGLGLAIVKKYVEAMNGKVWCESVPGNGAEFIIAFSVV